MGLNEESQTGRNCSEVDSLLSGTHNGHGPASMCFKQSATVLKKKELTGSRSVQPASDEGSQKDKIRNKRYNILAKYSGAGWCDAGFIINCRLNCVL